MIKDPRMTIAVISCDNYQDVVGYYLDFVSKNWSDCPFDIVVATEELDLHSEIAKTLRCGTNTTWTKRAIDAINSCESKYILLTVDDLYMSEKVDSEEFIKILDFMDSHSITYYRIPWHLANNKRYKTHPDNSNVNMIPKNMPYGRSIGSSIWERNELLELLGDGSMSAWELEEFFSREAAQNIGGGYYEHYVADKRYLLHSIQMVSQGKWEVDSVKRLHELGYDIDTSKRGFLSSKVYLRRKVIGTLGTICPVKFRKPIKKMLSKLGVKFVTKD